MPIDRSIRPPSSSEVNFSPPRVQKFSLKNGLNIFLSKKTDLPIVRLNLLIKGGSKFDPDGQKGLCNLLAMCVDEGAGELNALELADEFEMLGAQFVVSCTDDFIILSIQVLKENFISTLKLLADIITQSHLQEKDFNREKHKILVRINQSRTEPDYIADTAFPYFLLGKDSPYAFPTIGTEKTVQNIQLDLLKNSYNEFFAPSNSAMIVVGNLDEGFFKNELEEKFRSWNNSSILKMKKNFLNKTKRRVYVIDKPDSVQTEIRTGHIASKRNEKDFLQKQIINLVLGGQFSSRLNLNLREKNGYTYGVHSQFNYLKEAGFFTVSTSVDLANTASALTEIYREISNIKLGISPEELAFAKSSLTKKFPSNFETYRQIAAAVSTKVIYDLPDNYFDTYVGKVSSLNLDDVNSIAADSISPESIISVLVGDSKKILSQMVGTEFGQISTLNFDEIF